MKDVAEVRTLVPRKVLRHLLGVPLAGVLLVGVLESGLGGGSDGTTPPSSGKLLRVTMFEYHKPGAYRYLQLDETGRCQWIQFQRSIQRFHEGILAKALVDSIKRLVSADEFLGLKEEYDIYPVDPGEAPIDVEDTYVLLMLRGEDLSKRVLAHEKAAPELLRDVVRRLTTSGRSLGGSDRRGEYLVVTLPEIAAEIRWLRPVRSDTVALTQRVLDRIPALKKGMEDRGWLHVLSSADSTGFEDHFSTPFTRVYLHHLGEELALCRLSYSREGSRR